MIHRTAVSFATAALVSTLVLSACGGGGSDASTQSSLAIGKISGFGSIVVNGVHYQGGSVKDEDDTVQDQGELKLGMVVEVHAGAVETQNGVATATAQSITISSLLRGPVESVAVDGFVVLGQTVRVTPATVFDDDFAGGLTALTAGGVVKVYGTFDPATGVYTATRVEPKSGAEKYRLSGAVSAYNPDTKTLTIGTGTSTTVIDVSAATVPAGLVVGSLVRVKLQTTRTESGAWVAVGVKLGLFDAPEVDHAEVEGTITAFTSASAFKVDGLPVDASNARFEDDPAGLALGVRVEVEGTIVNGVLVASKVEIETEDEQDDFEVDGAITAVSGTTFVVHGVTVSIGANTNFVDGGTTNLTVGARVEVEGVLSSDGVTLVATEIEFKR